MAQAEEQKGTEAEPKKKGKSKLIIIIVVAVVVLSAGTAAGLLLIPHGEEPVESGLDAGLPEQAGPRILLEPFVVNLSDTEISRYLKMTMEVELKNEEAAEKLEHTTTQVRDSMMLLLSSKTYADIKPVSGKIQLKDEIVKRINEILGKPLVVQVYFTEFLVQP